jgi:MFS family permease
VPSRHAAVILALAFGNMALASGITLGFSVFFGALLADFGGTRGETVGIFSALMLTQGLASPSIGWVHDRLGARAQTVVGATLLATGLLLSAAITAPWQLYLTYGVLVGLGAAALTWVGMAPVLARWFRRRLATVNSFAYAGMGIGTIALAPLLQWLILRFGWRTAFLALGTAVLATAVPANLWLQRPPRPEEVDDPAPRPAASAGPAANGADYDAGLRAALRTPHFWGLAVEFFCISFGVFLVAAHQVEFAADAGFDRLVAASAFGLMGFMSGVGRIVFAVFSDTVGKQAALGTSFACSIAGIALLLLAGATGSGLLLTAYALVFGIGFGARGPILAADAAARFPGPHFGVIFGTMTLFHGIGSATGPLLGGLLFDLGGSYTLSFLFGMLSLAAAWTTSAVLARRRPKAA